MSDYQPIGHSFEWFNYGESRFADPPPDCPCRYCGCRYDSIIDIHHCPVMIERKRVESMGGPIDQQ